MRLTGSVTVLASLLVSSAFAQLPLWRCTPGTWHTEAGPNKLISILITKDGKDALVVSNENGLVSFGIESPRYLKVQEKKLKAWIRFDSDRPKMIDFLNVDHHMAVPEKDRARGILDRLATAKKMRVRMVNIDEAHCWGLAFFDIAVKLPANTPQVLGKVLSGSKQAARH